MDANFPFKLSVFDKVTMRRIGCNLAHQLSGKKDKLPN